MVFELGIGRISLRELGKLLKIGKPLPDVTPRRIVTDSREITEGDLFCALKGERDGHVYAEEAASRGAIALLGEKKTNVPIPHLITASAQNALAVWAEWAREHHTSCRYIAITGSVGKTTTKNVLATLLRTRFNVFASEANYNNFLGVPLSLLSVPPEAEIAILELGTNAKGEIAHLSRIVKPDDALITAIGHAHIGAFGSLEGTLVEKAGILDGLSKKGRLFVPESDPLLSRLCDERIRRASPYLEAEDIVYRSALGLATAIAREYGSEEEELKDAIARALTKDERRRESTVGGIHLIDDSYNASPESMLAAFDFIKSRAKGRRILVIGDMLELGEKSAALHREIGIRAAFADEIFLLGAYARDYIGGIKEADPKASIYLLGKSDALACARILHKRIHGGDTLLFKASHAVGCEKIVLELSKLLEASPKK